MNQDPSARLQQTLRAIERGERLASIDDLLIRQVLQQPPSKPPKGLAFGTAHTGDRRGNETLDSDSVQGSDAYRALVQLRKQKQLAAKNESSVPSHPEPVAKPANTSPDRIAPVLHRSSPIKPARVVVYDKIEGDRQQQQHEHDARNKHDAAVVTRVRQEMKQSLARTQRQLDASQREVELANAEMDVLLAASQSVLSSTFLFERNLTDFCHERSVEVIQRVLQRFKHRYYELFYQQWVDVTRHLRLVEQKRAVATIIRVFHGHQARKLRRVLQREAAQLQLRAKQIIELRVSYRHHQAVKIQRVWCRYTWKQCERARFQRKQKALFLQRRWKDRKLQRNAVLAALTNAKVISAAVHIQKHMRGFITRRRVTRHKRELARQQLAMAIMTRNTSRQALLHWKLERHGAAYMISSVLYPVLVRQRFRKSVRLLRQQRAGTLIARNVVRWVRTSQRFQRFQRGRQLAVAERLRDLLLQEQLRRNHAAVQIQKTMLCWWVQQQHQMQQRRTKKLARLKRIRAKVEQLEQAPALIVRAAAAAAAVHPVTAAVVIAKASAGLTDVMKQAWKRGHPSTSPPALPDAAAATKIQRAYLRHRHHVHFRLVQWKQQARAIEKRVQKRHYAAIRIQSLARGMLARRVARESRARRLLCRRVGQWKWRRATRRTQAARRILHWLKHKHTQRLAKLWKVQQARQLEMATRLQVWLRRTFFYRRHVGRYLAQARRREEARVFAAQSLVVCTQHVTDRLVLQSAQPATFDESVKSYVKGWSSVQPTKSSKPLLVLALARFPILPLVFLAVSGVKDPADLDLKALLLIKMERSKLIALFKVANRQAKPSKQPPHARGRHTESVSMTDVDVALAKAAGASKRALTYSEFVQVLSSLAEMTLRHVKRWWSRHEGGDARLLALFWQLLAPIADLKPLVVELHAYTAERLDAHSRVVQRVFLRRRDAARGLLLKLQLLQQREMDKKCAAAVLVQASVRRLLARQVLRTRIQATYEKYIDPEWGLPYWLNPNTGFSTWQKPYVLGDADVDQEAVPFPPPDQVLTVACQGTSGCGACSDWYCYLCDQFFCVACVLSFHRQEKDANGPPHEMEKLHKCGLCLFQVASRQCTGCQDAIAISTKKGQKRRSDQHSEQEIDDLTQAKHTLYCDVCFAFVHRRGAAQVHKSVALLELCADCLDEVDKKLAPVEIETQSKRKPYPRAVQWLCSTDQKRVCTSCACLLHPVESCGELTKLQLVTIQMKQRAELLAKLQDERERSDVELIKRRELAVMHERAAKKIQTFWRNSTPLIRARRVAKALRAHKDAAWQQRQRDLAVEAALPYQIRNALGRAPPLPSDTVVERRLRELTALHRRQMRLRARAFGLLLNEYMQLGVPLPGIARVAVGTKYMTCSEDLRGWILNRQTLRLKKLPSTEQREHARRVRFRHGAPPLENKAWLHDLEKWQRDPSDTVLVDIDAKQRITEHNVPLASAFVHNTIDNKNKDTGEAEPVAVEDQYVMFLVEFSMDPARIVWLNHSLAERFAVWRKEKQRDSRARKALQSGVSSANDARVVDPLAVRTAGLVEAAVADYNEKPAGAQGDQAIEQTSVWPNTPSDGYDYSSYYTTEYAWPAASSTAESQYPTFDGHYSTALGGASTGYDYTCANAQQATTTTTTTTTPGYAAPLVASADYFSSEDGNAAAWQAYYEAHPEMARGSDDDDGTAAMMAWSYDDPSSYLYGSTDYNSTAAYAQQEPWGSAGGDSSSSSVSYGDQAYPAAVAAAAAPSPTMYPSEEAYDPVTQQTYYYNHETQQTSWEYPYGS